MWRVWVLQAGQDIHLRYRRSLIGPFWISISLAAMMFGLGYLYSQIFRIEMSAYLVYLGAGLLTWNFIQQLVTEGCLIVTENESNLRNLPLPISTLALRGVYRNLVIFAHNVVVIVPMMLLMGAQPQWTWLWAIPGVFALALFGMLFALTLGPMSARFRDVPQVITSLLAVAFFLTPIIWKADQLTDRAAIALMNPLHHMIEIVRAPLMGAAVPTLSWMVVGGVLGVLLLVTLASLGHARQRVFLWL